MPGLKTKNGLKIMLVKGELGKQEVCICVSLNYQNFDKWSTMAWLVEHLIGDRRVANSRLSGVTVLCP